MKTKAMLWLTVFLITATCRADLPPLKQQLRMPAIVLLKTPAELDTTVSSFPALATTPVRRAGTVSAGV